MHIDFCASAWAVHVHYQMMKAVFCWAWNGDKQVPFSTRLPRVKKEKKKVHSAAVSVQSLEPLAVMAEF